MQTIFDHGQYQDILAVLKNKDERVETQNKLLKDNPSMTVVAAKLNIPGPIKNNKKIQEFFVTGLDAFESKLLTTGVNFVIKDEWLEKMTGPERFYLIEEDAAKLKSITSQFEEMKPSFRLFDLDVLTNSNGKIQTLSRADASQPPRKCLICGRPAKECGRSRRHTVEELQKKVSLLVCAELSYNQKTKMANWLTRLAQQALLYEASAWPKPGLVDPVEHGAHLDMDIFTFINSSASLQKYLHQAALLGTMSRSTNLSLIFEELREYGKKAEKAMFTATNNINTHKGAVFSLGVFVAATGYSLQRVKRFDAEDIQAVIKQMMVNLIDDDLKHLKAKKHLTAGEKQYLEYGLSGIRGEAHAGYPTVFMNGLPALLASTGSWNSRILTTFLELAMHIEDSTLIKRAGTPSIQEWKNQEISECLAMGGISTNAGRQKLIEIEKEFSQRNLSLGGTADLLIVTIFLGLVKEGLPNEFQDK
ncbi:triphosphoribosyl-dephospho-CoA synthase CitG [Limosilactobacillus albertensis]|uniref:Probable 2-(5''-triphosphoribosyl)-3'-dephosphocoenzyme-A synthase n=1 Tax=Limosilactobacillus albertensis TaxID=2759752 RepID=A0A839H9T7_9LACO|nr:triphosphoribosyl-dephospho-CoA synthase CitG [Limosilactobacillus albertensis]MBB1123677.1 triphosphoribosyl-dephospho-CoA synthase CitG [Limosilactobacillus albertensis]MCD7121549.1 triphosphoribosyl-dephospho-CoA synthase CitG [Limosilactobacillus albertensis]